MVMLLLLLLLQVGIVCGYIRYIIGIVVVSGIGDPGGWELFIVLQMKEIRWTEG